MSRHAYPTGAQNVPTVSEPTYAERARTLIYQGRVGTLSTLSRQHPGHPFGSVMPYALDERGRPFFLISTMAMHTQNLQGDRRASLLVTQPGWTGDPLATGRVTLRESSSSALCPLPNRLPSAEKAGMRGIGRSPDKYGSVIVSWATKVRQTNGRGNRH